MELFQKLLTKAFFYTKRSFFWWLLGVVQLVNLAFLVTFTKAHYFQEFILTGWFFTGLVFLSLSTLWLWLDIQAKDQNVAGITISMRTLTGLLVRLFLVNIVGYLIIYAFRLIFVYWGTFTLFSSLLITSWISVGLFVVLCGQKIGNALKLTIDLWFKLSAVPAVMSLSLMMAHSISFALARLFNLGQASFPQFSVLPNFVTMLILLVVLLLICGIIATALNVFLVLGFLELIKRYGNPQKIRNTEEAAQPAMGVSSFIKGG